MWKIEAPFTYVVLCACSEVQREDVWIRSQETLALPYFVMPTFSISSSVKERWWNDRGSIPPIYDFVIHSGFSS